VFTQGRGHTGAAMGGHIWAVMGKSEAVAEPSAHPGKRNDVGKRAMQKTTS